MILYITIHHDLSIFSPLHDCVLIFWSKLHEETCNSPREDREERICAGTGAGQVEDGDGNRNGSCVDSLDVWKVIRLMRSTFLPSSSSHLWPSSTSLGYHGLGENLMDEDIPRFPDSLAETGRDVADCPSGLTDFPVFFSSSSPSFSPNKANWNEEGRLIRSLPVEQPLLASYQYSPEVQKAIESILYIADHIKKEDDDNNVRDPVFHLISFTFSPTSYLFCPLFSSLCVWFVLQWRHWIGDFHWFIFKSVPV